jgi:hypothetical protein
MKNSYKIEGFRDHLTFKIYIDDLLHLEIRMANHDGMQSWLDGSKTHMYFIQFYRKQGSPILLEYDNIEIWKAILKIIDEKI